MSRICIETHRINLNYNLSQVIVNALDRISYESFLWDVPFLPATEKELKIHKENRYSDIYDCAKIFHLAGYGLP